MGFTKVVMEESLMTWKVIHSVVKRKKKNGLKNSRFIDEQIFTTLLKGKYEQKDNIILLIFA